MSQWALSRHVARNFSGQGRFLQIWAKIPNTSDRRNYMQHTSFEKHFLSSTNNCNLQIHHKENPRRFQHFFQEKKDVVSFFKSFNSAFTFQRPSNNNKGKSKCILFLKAFVNNENVRGVSCHPDLMGNCTCSHIS